MSCECDKPVDPNTVPAIRPGLPTLPLQTRGFAEIRAALLTAIQTTGSPWLAAWRGRDAQDLGVMLLEFWAYIGDVLGFYDQVHANELFLRTATQRTSLRRLADLLGYLPHPAVGATAYVALLASDRQPLALPAGSQFRSIAFGSEAPQVFESRRDATVYPDANQWSVAPPRETELSGSIGSILLDAATAAVRIGDPLRIVAPDQSYASIATSVAPVVDRDGTRWVSVGLAPPPNISPAIEVAKSYIEVGGPIVSLWSLPHASGEPSAFDSTSDQILLDGTNRQIVPGAWVLVRAKQDIAAFQVTARGDQLVTIRAATAVNGISFPAIQAQVTQLTLDTPIADPSRWTTPPTSAGDIVVSYGLVRAGVIGGAAKDTLAASDPIQVLAPRKPVGSPTPDTFAFTGADDRGAVAHGQLEFASGTLTLASDAGWTPELELPVTAYGNVVEITRGQTVATEVLGSGDASQISQTFKLQKSPLTYLPAPSSDSGVASTLTVWVARIRWTEVSTFYGAKSSDQVYIVRQDDTGASWVTFGDGVQGSRLPTGAGNVVASYRYGAGAASPPANGITQLARPLPKLRAALNPVAAAGGADAESAGSMRVLAPTSALLLGRTISLVDFQAAAAAVPGAVAALASWRWSDRAQTPLVHVEYIGDAGVQALISQRLRGMAEPTVQFQVERALGVATPVTIDVTCDADRIPADVEDAVTGALLDPGTGMLAPQQIGVGTSLFRSQLFAAIQAVPGVVAVTAITWSGVAMPETGVDAPAGAYFDVPGGGLTVQVIASSDG